ncbi:hypothetical protein CPB83DRAFT_900100 [Crepidotus variabilis]|uniref:Uncharacterized protein n=1 Tax=Crepidotus variabilis TaxID=179855 RepID=A0A9P6JI85_9AGAR|nr:hypothetical protein CPB83DRAFT_900100 [Crepidotus variabilis]
MPHRRKRTKRQTTGAPAPRIDLESDDTSNVAPATEKPLAKRRKVSRLSTITLDINIQGPETTSVASNWCLACQDGGDLRICDEPNCEGTWCERCLPDPSVEEVFSCPRCHLFGAGKVTGTRNKDPLVTSSRPIKLAGEAVTRGLFEEWSSEPMAIISFYLTGMSPIGLCSSSAYSTLVGYLEGNVALVNIDFNLHTHLTEWDLKIEELVTQIRSGRLKRYRQFAFILTDHSDPARGDLHIGPNNSGSAELTKVFGRLFPPALTAIVRSRTRAELILASCGSFVRFNINELKAYACNGPFHRILGFTQEHLQPVFLNDFVTHYLLYDWVRRPKSFYMTLQGDEQLGAHTNILIFSQAQKHTRVPSAIESDAGLQRLFLSQTVYCLSAAAASMSTTALKPLQVLFLWGLPF